MRYRDAVTLLTTIASVLLLHPGTAAADPKLPVEVNVSGDRGQDGTSGTNRSGSASTSQKGADGGHAGRSTPGVDAGDIEVTLEVPQGAKGPVQGKIIIRGTTRSPSDKTQAIQGQYDVGSDGSVNLRARGGAGGKGGRGGDGEGGGRGRDGSNATEYSDGTDGGPGGDGGRGGDGTTGSDGGKGGKVSVKVKAEDTHLLMLVEQESNGGAGGAPGSNGRGGSGGAGGDGGSSHSWTTYRTEHYTETVSNGDGSTRTESRTRQVPEFHTRRGGSDGRRGSSGSSGSGSVSAGKDGRSGSFDIAVQGPNGTEHYDRRYDIAIQSYDIKPASLNGILEPGEEVSVGKIVVKNTGGMPTPPDHSIQVFLENSEWAVSRPVQLKIPRSLKPGEQIEIPGSLALDIADRPVARVGERFVTGDKVTAASWLPDANRSFKDGTRMVPIQITFPVEIEPIDGWNSLTPGKVTKVRWRIKNISTRAIGQNADLKRLLNTRLTKDPASKAPIVIYDAQRREVTLAEGLLSQIEDLKPGETQVIESYVGMKKGATAYEHAKVVLDLNLGAPQAPGKGRVIQQREYKIQVGEVYQHNELSNVLLVTSEKTTKEQIDAWKKTYQALGQTVDTMNLSHQGNLDFGKVFKDFGWRSVVMLNEDIHVPGTGAARPEDFMSKTQFLQSAAGNGIKVTVIGGTRADPGKFLKDVLIPSSQHRKSLEYKTEKKFREYSDKLAKVGMGAADKTADLIVDSDHVLPVQRTYIFRKPNMERSAHHSEEAAQKLSGDLTQQRPDMRYMVFHEPVEPVVTGKGPLGIGKRYRVGQLVVAETMDKQTFSGLVVEQSLAQTHSPAFITGAENTFTAALALQTDDKIHALNQFFDGKLVPPPGMDRKQLGELLAEALISDVAAEQRALIAQTWNKGFNDRMLKTLMPVMEKITSSIDLPVINMPALGSIESDVYLKFTTKLKRMSKNQVGWWQYMLPSQRTRRVAGVAVPMAERLMVRGFGSPGKARRKAADKQVAQIEKQLKLDEGRFTSETLTDALPAKRGITTDIHVAADAESRVLPMEEHRKAKTVDDAREAKREKMKNSINAAKQEFIQEWECAAEVDCVRVTGDRLPSADTPDALPDRVAEALPDASGSAKCIPRELEKVF